MEPKNLEDTKGGQVLDRIHKIQGLVVDLKGKTCRAVDDLTGPDCRPITEPEGVIEKAEEGIFPRMLASIILIERDVAECAEAIGRLQS